MKKLLFGLFSAGFLFGISAQEPLWDLAKDEIPAELKHGDIRKVNGTVTVGADRWFGIPASAFPDQKNFTVKIGVKFKDVSPGTVSQLLLKMKDAQDDTGLGLSLIHTEHGWKASRAIVNGMHIGGNGQAFQKDMRCDFTIDVRNGIPAYYKYDRLMNRFFVTVIPNREPMWILKKLNSKDNPMKEIEIVELKVYGPDYKYVSKDDPAGPYRGLIAGKGWNIEAPRVTDAKRPKMLFYGDSISYGYKNALLKKFGDKVYAYHWGHFDNGAGNAKDLKASPLYKSAASSAKYDVIVFNNGLHSLHWTPDKVSDEQIYANYTRMLKGFQAGAPGAKIYYLLTTPHTGRRSGGNKTVNSLGEKNVTVQRLNRIAEKVMKDNGIEVIDMYSPLAARLDLASGDQFHWSGKASELIADQVAEKTFEALKKAGKLK